MSKSIYKTYDHDENKLSIKDYIEELEQDDECITKNDIMFKIYVNAENKKVNFVLEVKDLNSGFTAQTENKPFDSKKKLINWVKTSQLLTSQTFGAILKKSSGTIKQKFEK